MAQLFEQQVWVETGAKYNLTKKLGASLDLTQRFGYDGLSTFFPQVSFRYKVSSWFRPSMDYRVILSKSLDGTYSTSQRINGNLQFYYTKKRLEAGLRIRYQYSFERIGAAYDSEFDQAWRIKPSVQYNIKGLPLTPELSAEFFYNPENSANGNQFNRIRYYGGADIESPARALQLIAAARTNTLGAGFDAEDQALADLTMSNPLRASLYAFNLIQKKRKKVEGAPKPALGRKVARVGVVGAGLMASQLALLLLRNLKTPIVMTDIDQERADKGVAWVRAELAKLVEKKRMSEEAARRLSLLISGSADQQVFAGCDFVIEAIFEELALKQDLFKKLENIVSPECVIATNTSSLSVEAMSEGMKNPERVIGFHFFNPVAIMPLLEVARTSKTDDATTATAVNIGKELKKTMVITKDAPGFVVNRLLTRFMGEITDAMDEGTPADVADSALRSVGFPMSPFELVGLVGPGVALHVAETLNKNLGPRYRISPTMQRLVKEGVRTFYIKDESGKLVPNPAAVALMEKGDQPSTGEEVRIRALKALAEEARMMLDEGVVSTPAEIDICMLLGAGWPMVLGGILPYLDREGISEAVSGQRFHPKGVASLA